MSDLPKDFDPEPTVIQGGLDRLTRCWESCRDANPGGYGSGFAHEVKGWWPANYVKTVTSCSPFTGTVLGMIFDKSGTEAAGTVFAPMYNGGREPIPWVAFNMHNGNYFHTERQAVGRARASQFLQRKWRIELDANARSPGYLDDAAHALYFFNLAYEIDPRDMRRGDLVKFDWISGNGHSAFCWDVHLDAQGDVDAFQFLSSNSGPNVGVSVACRGLTNNYLFIAKDDDGHWQKKFDPLFENREEYIEFATWYCLPGISKGEVDKSTFKGDGPRLILDSSGGEQYAVGHNLRVSRFWGVSPPARLPANSAFPELDPRKLFAMARSLTKEMPPDSYATGKGRAPASIHIPRAPAQRVKGESIKKDPDAVKKAPPKPVQQPDDNSTTNQKLVEIMLHGLHSQHWIDKDPGSVRSIYDEKTRAAVRDFQTKFKVEPVDGSAGPITRKALFEVHARMTTGQPNPNARAPKKPKPQIKHVIWMRNRMNPGEANGLWVHCEGVERFATFQVRLTDIVSDKKDKSATLSSPGFIVNDVGAYSFTLPSEFHIGAKLGAHVVAETLDGARLEKSSHVLLYVGPVLPAEPLPPPTSENGGLWDESRWPRWMREVLAELRETEPTGDDWQRREITQFGAKTNVLPGDTPVLSADGEELARLHEDSLFLADIEGTLRVGGRVFAIVKSGNVYDVRVVKVIDGKERVKYKPNREEFDPIKSRWKDVTDEMPWGAAARGPLIPFRTLAYNSETDPPLFFRKVYIEQLAGLVLPTGERHNGVCIVNDVGGMAPPETQFDFFVADEDHHINIPTLAESHGGAVCRVLLLDPCQAASKRRG